MTRTYFKDCHLLGVHEIVLPGRIIGSSTMKLLLNNTVKLNKTVTARTEVAAELRPAVQYSNHELRPAVESGFLAKVYSQSVSLRNMTLGL